MIEETRKLLQLEEVDRAIRDVREELASFGPEREAAASEAAADRAAVVAAEGVAQEREQEHRVLEVELQDVDQLVVKLDAQVYEVTSKHAMQAIQTELEASRVRKSDAEDRVLEALDTIDTATSGVEAAEAEESEHAAARASAETARSARETDLEKQLEERLAERDREAAGVERLALERYEDSRRKAWPVLAHVLVKSCPTCRIVIPPQKWNDIANAQKLVTCGSCHRILYGDKVAEAQ